MSRYKQLKEEAFRANLQLPKLGLVIFTFGNVSVLDRSLKAFAIKPSGVAYEDLRPDMMVVVSIQGNILEGQLNPSSDTKTHAFLYREWSEINSVVHTHSTYATAWAQAQRDIPVYGTTHADHSTVDIPCAVVLTDDQIKRDYEEETGNQIVQCFAERKLSYEEVEMILLAQHGPFTWGKTATKAVHNSAVLEYLAKMALLTEQIDSKPSRLKESLIKKHHERKHGPNSYYGQR